MNSKKLPTCKLDFLREDDFVEYFIFPKIPRELQKTTAEADSIAPDLLEFMNKVHKETLHIIDNLVRERNYIWHKDPFYLQIRTGGKQETLLNEEYVDKSAVDAAISKALQPHLHGVTHYGDNIADEWFIVFLLSELTRQLPHCIARIIDSDGEFLLIEAAEHLPKWANPETCEQRVYLAHGLMHLLENSPGKSYDEMPSVQEALIKLNADPKLFCVSAEIQHCIDERLAEFRSAESVAEQQQHQQIVRLPLGVAAILRKNPHYISAAVRAFCERDTQDSKVLRSMRYFPPEACVRQRVRFTRCLYAMLMHNQFTPDRRTGWQLTAAKDTEAFKEQIIGVKIACGFEILANRAKANDDNSPAWRAYLRSLQTKGYFRNELEGSQLYHRLYAEARAYFKCNNEHFRTNAVVGHEILTLLQELNMEQLTADEDNNMLPSESDDWLNISAADLDNMLMERYGAKNLFKSTNDMDANNFTKQLADFLDKQSGYDGITLDSDDDVDEMGGDADDSNDDDDDEIAIKNNSKRHVNKMQQRKNFKTNVKKSASMRRACKQNPVVIASSSSNAETATTTESTQVRNVLEFNVPEDNWESNSDMDDYGNEDEMEMNISDLDSTELSVDDIKAYMAQMDRELAKTTIGKTFSKKTAKRQQEPSSSEAEPDDFDDIESFEPININVNTLKNMMDSYKSQIGGPGPVSNLLSAMGVGMSNAATTDGNDLRESTV